MPKCKTLNIIKQDCLPYPAAFPAYPRSSTSLWSRAMAQLEGTVSGKAADKKVLMTAVKQQVEELFDVALLETVGTLEKLENLKALKAKVTAGNPKFQADYQLNNVPQLFRSFGKSLGFASPLALGETVCDKLPKNPIIESCVVAGAGFVNIRISSAWIQQHCEELAGAEQLCCQVFEPLRMIVDFSQPNIAKEMHVGHLRSTIMGESVSRICEFLGHEVHRLNHVGDWGTQFGMLIEHMKESYPDYQDRPCIFH